MKAVVVYESMFGSTRAIADGVAQGLRSRFDDVLVLAVADASVADVVVADLVVVGGPTHVHGMSRPSTRAAAVGDPAKYSGGVPALPGAGGIGLREWFEGLPPVGRLAAAFDTRADAPPSFTGRASRGIGHRLHAVGCHLVTRPESFIVGKGGRLRDGETDRAERWGRTVAAVAATQLAASA